MKGEIGMVRKTVLALLLAVLAASLFTACTQKDEQRKSGLRTYADYVDSGKTIAVQSGEVFSIVARDLFKAKAVPEYMAMPELLEALRNGRVDAVITDGSYVKQLEDSGRFPEFDYLWVAEDFFVNKSAPVFHTAELRNKYNGWLAAIKADGTYAEIESRWIGASLPAQEDIPKIGLTGENGTLRVCDTGNYPPFTYFDENGSPTGYDYELISRFAQHLGMKPEITMMSYDGIIPCVNSGRADMSACVFTITGERGESTLFGAPTIVTRAVLIVPKGASNAARPRDYTDFAGKNIAVITGVLTYHTTEEIGAKPVDYEDSASAAEEVRQGRVAGYMHALTAVQVMASQLKGFEVIPIPKKIFSAQIGAISHDQAVIDRFNVFLSGIKADGTLDAMQKRWFSEALNLDAPMPSIPGAGKNGVIKVALCSDSIPYVYAGANGGYSGYSVELALRFGAHEGKKVEFIDMDFGGLIPYIVSRKADLGIANLAITEERKKSVLFTDPFFDEQHGILALKQGGGVPAANAPLTFADFAGKRVGAVVGNLSGEIIAKHIGTPAYYSEQSAGIEDVRMGRLSGFMTDLSILRVIAASPGFEDTQVVPVPAAIFAGPLGAFSVDQGIIVRFNAFLKQLERDGTLADMRDRWLENVPGLNSAMPNIPLSGQNGTLTVATSGLQLPFSYFGNNNELKGYSIELAMRFAAHMGMQIKFASMDFGGLIPYVASGKADLGLDAVTITEERKKSVAFSDSIYDDLLGIITLKQSGRDSAADNASALISHAGFAGKKLGVILGMTADTQAKDVLKAAPVFYFDTASAIEDLRNRRIDGMLYDFAPTKIIAGLPENQDLRCIEVPLEVISMPMGAVSSNQGMIDRFNVFLKAFEASGLLARMQDRWLESLSALDAPMPEIPLSSENGILQIAIDDAAPPYTYRGGDGELRGFCVELAYRFAQYERMGINFIPMDFSALIPFVGNGKADLGIDFITITKERQEVILFTNPFYNGPQGILALKEGGGVAAAEGRSYTDFFGNAIGVGIGSVADTVIEGPMKATPVYYNGVAEAFEDVRRGRVDGFIWDLSAARVVVELDENKDLECVEVPIEFFFAPLGAFAKDQGIVDKFNAFLAGLKADGTLAKMQDRWLENVPDLETPMPDIPLTGEKGVLKIATCGTEIPFSYVGNNSEIKGYSIELARRFAAYLGMDMELIDMDFSGLIPYINSGKADFGIANVSITEERKKSVLFTDSIYDDHLGIVALKQTGNAKGAKLEKPGGFFRWLKTAVQRNLITDNRWKMVVNGLGVTMVISLFAQLFGTVLGGFVCWLLTRKNKLVQRIGSLYCGLINGTPIVVLLMITYYIIFGSTQISNIVIAIAAFMLVMGANVAENLKGAIETIDPVEI